MNMASRYVVMVTGGAGFLGQHVVKLLQTNADYVTEIKVLDIVPYKKKLDYKERVPVTSYTGSVTDYNTVLEACKGADCVMHIASIVDTRMVPDEQFSYNVNVKGTENVIRACKETGVRRMIYCSSMDVVIGQHNIYDGNEANTQHTTEHDNFFPVYGPTKAAAERLTLDANGTSLRTVALRPAVLYGELEERTMGTLARTVNRLGFYVRLDSSGAGGIVLHTYAGNVAWAFICADETLRQEDRNENIQKAAGKAYFIADDSPQKDLFSFHDLFMKDAGAKPFPVSVSVWLAIYLMSILYFVICILRSVFDINFIHGMSGFYFLSKTFIFSYDKAKKELGYTPLFSFNEARQMSVKHIKDVIGKKHLKSG